LHLKQLILTNFKNYAYQSLDFSERLNCFVGRNGMGKTNLLDAIYYLCMCKSHFGVNDANVRKHGEDFFRLEGHFLKEEKNEKVVSKVIPRKKKSFERNDVQYDRLMDHIGLLPVVMVAPDDTMIAREGSEERRRFLDNTLSQLDRLYLKYLVKYNRLLQQRNALLKQFAAERRFDEKLLSIFDEQLQEPASYIVRARQQFSDKFEPKLRANYQVISNDQEEVGCVYKSKLLTESFEELLEAAREKDRILQRTTVGIHKDDMTFKIEDYSLKSFASQGQLKSFILALKLAQYEFLRAEKGVAPILLLDDIFDKLDNNRVQQLIKLILERNYGQTFITDTDEKRLKEILEGAGSDFKMFIVNEGTV